MKNLLRNLFYACGIVAAISFTVHQWATPALGAFSASIPGIAFAEVWHVGASVLRDDGRVFVIIQAGGPWIEFPILAPPVPLSQIALWSRTSILDTSGNAWTNSGFGWVNSGPAGGGGPTAVTPSTWSGIKGQFAPKSGGER